MPIFLEAFDRARRALVNTIVRVHRHQELLFLREHGHDVETCRQLHLVNRENVQRIHHRKHDLALVLADGNDLMPLGDVRLK